VTEAPRLVSLCPSMTETLFDIGAGPQVVGATRFCVRPERMEGVVRIGGTKDPRIERILDLQPSLVLANREENRLEDVEALRAAGVEVHDSMPRRVDEVPALIRDVGQRVGRAREADAVADRLDDGILRLRARRHAMEPVTFLVLVWRRPWIAASADTFLSNLLFEAGGSNVLEGGGDRYPELTTEEVASLRPERVLLPSEPFPFSRQHVDELARATRMDPELFLPCDGQLLTWHGSRSVLGLSAAARWMDRSSPQEHK
jgi:iron complex transport system substrate-binding protein